MSTYADVMQVKLICGIDSDNHDRTLQALAQRVDTLIDTYCNRTFHIVEELRTFDAPYGSMLPVADLWSVDTVTAYGDTVTDYLPVPATPPYTWLIRQTADTPPQPQPWCVDAAGVVPYQAITVQGVWAFAARYALSTWIEVIPAQISQAAEMITTILWDKRALHYSARGGNDAFGVSTESVDVLWPGAVTILLAPFVRPPVRAVAGWMP